MRLSVETARSLTIQSGIAERQGLMATRISKLEKEVRRENAIKRLRRILKSGDTLYTVLKSRSGSGMYRHIAVIAVTKKRGKYDEPVSNISAAVTDIFDWKWHGDDSVGVGGCGMDMGFHIVYELSRELFNDGYALKHKWL